MKMTPQKHYYNKQRLAVVEERIDTRDYLMDFEKDRLLEERDRLRDLVRDYELNKKERHIEKRRVPIRNRQQAARIRRELSDEKRYVTSLHEFKDGYSPDIIEERLVASLGLIASLEEVLREWDERDGSFDRVNAAEELNAWRAQEEYMKRGITDQEVIQEAGSPGNYYPPAKYYERLKELGASDKMLEDLSHLKNDWGD